MGVVHTTTTYSKCYNVRRSFFHKGPQKIKERIKNHNSFLDLEALTRVFLEQPPYRVDFKIG